MRWFRWVAGSAAVVVVVLGAGAAFLATLDLNSYKDEIQGSLERATGHRVAIDGPLHLAWSPRLGLAASGVRIANADWASEPTMATVGEISVGVEAIPLLTGKVEIRRFMLSDVRLLLEHDADGRGNWERDAGVGNAGGELPPIRRIELARVTVVWKGSPGAAERVYHVERLSLAGDGPDSPLDALLVADLDGAPLELQGTLPALAAFGRAGATLPFDIAGSVAGTPVRIAARFQAEPGEAGSVRSMRIDAMTASYGAFSATGAATVDLTGPRPRIDAQLASDSVDLDSLGDGGATGDPMDRPLPLELLAIVDGTVKVEVARLVSAPWTLEGVSATATIADGALTVDPLGGSIAGGAVAGRMQLDNREPPARLTLAGTASGVDVGAISRAMRGEALIEGRGDAAIDLRAWGDTGRTFLGSAEGVARLVILRRHHPEQVLGTDRPGSRHPVPALRRRRRQRWPELSGRPARHRPRHRRRDRSDGGRRAGHGRRHRHDRTRQRGAGPAAGAATQGPEPAQPGYADPDQGNHRRPQAVARPGGGGGRDRRAGRRCDDRAARPAAALRVRWYHRQPMPGRHRGRRGPASPGRRDTDARAG